MSRKSLNWCIYSLWNFCNVRIKIINKMSLLSFRIHGSCHGTSGSGINYAPAKCFVTLPPGQYDLNHIMCMYLRSEINLEPRKYCGINYYMSGHLIQFFPTAIFEEFHLTCQLKHCFHNNKPHLAHTYILIHLPLNVRSNDLCDI